VKGYYDDPYIYEMEHKKSHKIYLPMLNRGIWSRVYAIKSNIVKILQEFPDKEINIISLGAGLDTLYFQLKDKFTNFKYIEFDYDDICFKKVELIKKSELLKTALDKENFEENVKISQGNISSKHYFLLRCDVTNIEELTSKIKETNIDFNNLTIVIAECLLVYIKKETTYEMLKGFTGLFKNIVMFEYDLVGAMDPFGQEMIENLKQREILIRGYEEVPDCKAHEKRYLETGFTKSQACDMLEYYKKCIPKEVRSEIEHKEFLDEFEEWNLLQSHSCFAYGLKLEDGQFEKVADIVKI
jgi:O-methyltransferase involved in polyketide biosynthesis